jgi:MFS family permease
MERATRNALAYAIPEVLWGFASAISGEDAMPAAFSDSFGGRESFVGLASLCAALSLSLPMVLTAWFVEPLRHKRLFVVRGHLATGSLYGLVALLIGLAASHGEVAIRTAYLVGTSAFYLALGFLIPVWLSLFGEVVPAASRGRVLGLVFVLNRVGAWVGGVTAHGILAAPWSAVDQWRTIFGLAGAAAVLGSLPFFWVVEDHRERPPGMPFRRYVKKFASSLRSVPGLGRFVVADLLVVTGMIVVWHYGKVAMDRYDVPREWAGRWTAIRAVGQIVAAVTIFALGTRLAPRSGLVVGAVAMTAGALLATVASSPTGFAGVAALGGAYYTSRMTCHAPQVLRLSGDRDGTLPIGVAMALSGLVAAFAPFLAGYAIPAWGHAIVFGGVALTCALGAVLLRVWVPDGDGNEVAAPAANESI